jgi:hypothetical protein
LFRFLFTTIAIDKEMQACSRLCDGHVMNRLSLNLHNTRFKITAASFLRIHTNVRRSKSTLVEVCSNPSPVRCHVRDQLIQQLSAISELQPSLLEEDRHCVDVVELLLAFQRLPIEKESPSVPVDLQRGLHIIRNS